MKQFLSILLVVCFALIGNAQQHNFNNLNVEDGLAQSQVYAICEDQRGYIWLGTRGGGISVFDGFEFSQLSTTDGLASQYINQIAKDANNVIWIATNGGLNYYENGKIAKVQLDKNNVVVRDIHFVGKKLLIATSSGLFEVENKQAKLIGQGNLSLCRDQSSAIYWNNQLVFGNNKGLFAWNGGTLKSFGKDVHTMNNSITIIRKDAKNNLWIGTYGDGLYFADGQSFKRIDLHQELYKTTILDIYFDNDKNAWLATLDKGVVKYHIPSKSFSFIGESEGLSNNHVRSIYQDQNGNMWFGTSGGGVSHYLGRQFTHYDERSGLNGTFIYSILRDKQKNLWIGNSKNGVTVIGKDSTYYFNASNGFANVKVKALAEDRDGGIYLGTDGDGVYFHENGAIQTIDALKRVYVKDMKSDAKGNIWIATAGNGLIKVIRSNGNFVISKYTTLEGILSNRITSIHFDKKGRLWYGSESDGVGCLENEKVSKLRITSSLGMTNTLIRCLTEDKNGRLWIGTAGGGLYYYPLYLFNKKVYPITTTSGLASDNIYVLSTDNRGNVIAGSEKGLDVLSFDQSGAVNQIKHLGKEDGFIGVETCQNSVWKDANGTLWFGTINGLSRFNPSELTVNNNPPRLSFRDVKLYYESLSKTDSIPYLENGQQTRTLSFDYSQNHLTFEFIGVNLSRPNQVVYQWMLEGFDEDWSPSSKERSILYSNLNPGEYTFKVRAANEDGIWSKEPLTFKFTVDAPFWKKQWFIVVAVLSLLLLISIIYLISIRRIRAKAKVKQHQVELEKNLLELEQKALRLQMNPHFIFNALNSIQSLIGTGKETEARYYLAKFSRLMRQILDNSRKSMISLEEEINTIENYLLVEQFCNNNRFTYDLRIDDNLERDFIQIPPMLIQPFIENAIKHGMKGSDEANPGQISIVFQEEQGMLEVIVEDNGIGRERASEMKKESKETYHDSASLIVTTERLASLESEHGHGTIEIIDLYDKNEEPAGTRIKLLIPIA